jgi:nicotinamidase-related amidase
MSNALIVIDLQKSFQHRPNWAAVSNPAIAKQVSRLVDHARASGDLVVWVLHTEPGTGTVFDPARGCVELMDGVSPEPAEPIVTKTSVNAFTSTNLQQLLTQRGIRELTICGIQTEQCCETTTRVAADLGYAVTFVTEATATFPIPHRDAPAGRDLEEILTDPTTLHTDDIIIRTEYALAGRFATITTVADVTASRRPVQ